MPTSTPLLLHYLAALAYRAQPLATLEAEVRRFHEMLEAVSKHLKDGTPLQGTTPERFQWGTLSDAIHHVDQLVIL